MELYPVPKSSMLIETPSSLRSWRFVSATGSSSSAFSVISSVSCLASMPAARSAPVTSS